jgi:hypothetical protein
VITTYTASPVFIHDIDMNKIGTGQDIARHGHGMYFGSPATAKHYLNDYRHYHGADHHITHQGMTLPKGSEGHQVASMLIALDMDKEQAAALLSGNAGALEMLDILHDGDTPSFEHQRGVLYEVRLPDVNTDEVRHWDHAITNDTLTAIAERFYEQHVTLPPTLTILGEDIELDGLSFAETSETLFEAALNHAIEEGELYSFNEDELREMWDARMRGDHHFSNLHEGEFEQLDVAFMDALSALTSEQLDLTYNSTWGDVYQHMTHVFEAQGADNSPAASSAFFANTLHIPMLQGEAIFGEHKAQEYVVFCESLLREATFTPLAREEQCALDYEHPLDMVPDMAPPTLPHDELPPARRRR